MQRGMRPAIAAAVTVAVICTAFVFSFAFLETPHAYAQAATSTDQTRVDAAAQTPQNLDDKAKLDGFTGVIYGFCTALGTGILWLGGMFFDYSMGYLVIGMGDLLGEGLGDMIDDVWIVVRDIFNLLFIFGLIYIGFRTILDINKANTQRTLIALIAAALLVNFSLFIAKAIVDLSNVTAFQIYSLISVEGDATRVDGEYTGIGAGFMQYLNLEASIGDNAEVLQDVVADDGNLPSGRVIIYGIMVLIFSLVAAFVFMAGAVFMVTRFVALILYMVFSPAMFAGMIFPGMQPYMAKWWRGFISNALVAPAFMFMLYLSLMAAEALQDDTGTLGAAFANPSGAEGTFMVILMFFVIMGFLVASLMVAKQFGTVGADRAVSMGRTALNKTRTGIQGFAGRNTIGRGSNWAQEKFTRWQEKPTENQSRLGRAMRTAAAATNFDRAAINVTEKGKSAKFGSGRSYNDAENVDKDRKKRLAAGAEEQRREQNIHAGIEATKVSVAGSIDQKTMDELAKAMKGLTEKQLTEGMKLEVLTNENVAVHLSEKNIETLEKSGKYSEAEIGSIKDARKKGFINIAREGKDATGKPLPHSAYNASRNPEWLANKGTDELAKMPTEVFTAEGMAEHLTPAMVEAKMKSGVSKNELEKIRENIDRVIAQDQLNASSNDGGPYTKQWKKWSERTAVGARLGLEHV